MNEPVKLVITLEGGMIMDISTCGVPAEVVVIDYDTDGDDDTVLVPPELVGDPPDSRPANAYVSTWAVKPENAEESALLTRLHA